jgi:hypothetical protein
LIIEKERGTNEKTEVSGDGGLQLYLKKHKPGEVFFKNIITFTSSRMAPSFVAYKKFSITSVKKETWNLLRLRCFSETLSNGFCASFYV